MTLEETLQIRWSADATLAALIPPERVCTAAAPPETTPPHVVFRRVNSKPVLRAAGGGCAEHVELAFVVTADDYDTAAEIVAALADNFDDADFDAGEGYVALLRKVGESRQSPPHGPAVFTVTYVATWWKS